MKKSIGILIAVVVAIAVIGGGYALFHKSDKSNTGSTQASTSKTTAPAVNNAVLVTKTDPKFGQYLADPNGKPLYTYDADTSGVSNCTGSCLAEWPAYEAAGPTADLPSGIATIKRSDNGKTQYTYNGMPLYYFVSDSQGKVTGDGVDNFHLATPTAASSSAPSQSSTPSQSSDSTSNYGYPY